MSKRVVIFGPPGTGKTTNCVRKIDQLIDSGLDPKRIGVVSFTKAAADTMTKRAGAKGIQVGTVHSFCFRLMQLTRDRVLDDMRDFCQKTGWQMSHKQLENIEQSEVKDADDYYALYELSRARLDADRNDTYANSHRPGTAHNFDVFCKDLDLYKSEFGQVDFTDMLERACATTCPTPELDVLFVDEGQDLSPLQWKVITRWAETIDQVYIAGDDDQAIFVWGGADPQGMTKFAEAQDAEIVVLDKSNRLPEQILKVAQTVVSQIRNRKEKVYEAKAGHTGHVYRCNSEYQVPLEQGSDTLVLYRNHSLRKPFEERCIKEGIPYVTLNGRPSLLQNRYARLAKLLMSVKALSGSGQPVAITAAQERALRRDGIGSKIKWGLDKGDWSVLCNESNLGLLLMIKMPPFMHLYYRHIISRYGTLDIECTVKLSTIHGVKGDEADRVILYNCMTSRSYDAMVLDPDSELRVFYVGVTRAKTELFIINDENGIKVL